jgi:hypothetical protein
MTALTIKHANLIEQALTSPDGTAKYWTSQTNDDLIQVLSLHGLAVTGVAPGGFPQEDDFWTVFTIDDKSKADAAVKPFRTPSAPMDFRLSPVDPAPLSPWACYQCPACQSTDTYWTDGDSVYVPVLPEGIADYNDIDTTLMVGECRACEQPLFIYEFAFTNVTNPDGDFMFCLANIAQEPDRYEVFHAEADGLAPWILSRRWYTTGKMPKGAPPQLPKGPFVVDFHQFGPFPLAEAGELSGRYGVARCSGAGVSEKWLQGEELFRNLANNAMQRLLAAVAAAPI